MELGNDWETEFEGAEAMNAVIWTLQRNHDYEKMALDTMLSKLREKGREKMKKCETDFYWSEKLVRVSYYRGIYRPFNCWTNNNRF